MSGTSRAGVLLSRLTKMVVLPGRVTWKDSRGAVRFACVTTRDISETGVFIEWRESTSIPLYRLVSFQIERDVRQVEGIPPALRAGRVLSAVYRLGSAPSDRDGPPASRACT